MKRTFKKLLAIMLTLTLCFTTLISVSPAEAATKKPKRVMLNGYKGKRTVRQGLSKTKIKRILRNSEITSMEANPQTLEELFGYLSYLYYAECDIINFASGTCIEKLNTLEEWPKDGIIINYNIYESLLPGNLSIMYDIRDNADHSDTEEYEFIEVVRTNEEKAAIAKCKQIAEDIKKQYPNLKAEEYIRIIADYLYDNCQYEKKNFDMYDLLYNGKGNCQAFSDSLDCIAKYLDIPCIVVDNEKINHAWNMFYGSDGEVWQVDATNLYYPTKLSSNNNRFKEIEYKDIELKNLAYEKMIMDSAKNRSVDTKINYSESFEIPESSLKSVESYVSGQVASGSAITIDITSTPTEEPTPTPTEEPTHTPTEEKEITPTPTEEPTPTISPTPTLIQEDNSGLTPDIGDDGKGQVSVSVPTYAPGTVEVIEDFADVIVKTVPKKENVTIDEVYMYDNGVRIYFSPIKRGQYQVRCRFPYEDWAYINVPGDSYYIFLETGKTVYVQVRTRYAYVNQGKDDYGEWSVVYAITKD